MCLRLCVIGCPCRLAVLPGPCWVLGNGSALSATHAGGRMLWCSARRAYAGFTSLVVVPSVRCQWVIGCAVPVLWWCLPLLLLVVIPLCTLTAANGARAHGARAKAGAQSFFLSFFQVPTKPAKIPHWLDWLVTQPLRLESPFWQACADQAWLVMQPQQVDSV
jgi:hypothetical protein